MLNISLCSVTHFLADVLQNFFNPKKQQEINYPPSSTLKMCKESELMTFHFITDFPHFFPVIIKKVCVTFSITS